MPRILLLAMAALLSACASEPEKDAPPPPPTVVQLQIEASADLNALPGGAGTPVRVRLYELRNATTFSRADYFSLVDKAQATLAADLVAQDELLVKPSDRQMQERTLDEGTRQFGIVVGYRELDAAVWRDVITVPLNQTSAYSLKFGARGVTVAPAPITEH